MPIWRTKPFLRHGPAAVESILDTARGQQATTMILSISGFLFLTHTLFGVLAQSMPMDIYTMTYSIQRIRPSIY